MDITPYLEPKIAPRSVFDSLAERRSLPRFVLWENGERRAVTWGAFAQQIRDVALFLTGAGLASADRAVIFAPNRVEWMSAALGIQAAGGVMVPVYASSTRDQAAYVVRHADAKVVFAGTREILARVFESWGAYAEVARIVVFDEGLDPASVLAELRAKGASVPSDEQAAKKLLSFAQAVALGRARDSEDPVAFERTMNAVSLEQPGLMLYTSGTSGNPKGVPLTHRNVAVNGADWLRAFAPILPDEPVDLLWLPMSHIFGYGEACAGNILGFTTHLCEPKEVMTRLKEVRPSVFMSVPSVWEKIAAAAGGATDAEERTQRLAAATGGRLRFCLSGGAGLKREVKETLHAAGILVLEGYGLTETSPTLTLNRPDGFRFDSVGKPLHHVELRLAEDGEILARGPSVFGGYHKDPAATKEAFTDDGWFKTGDVGRFTEDGFLQIVDRKKDILVTAGGKNVPPANIEQRFQDDPFIAHAVVYGDGRKYLVCGVWLDAPAVTAHLDARRVEPAARARAIQALVAERIERVNAELAHHETIKKFAVMDGALSVEAGFLTPTLKLRRKQVYQAFAPALDALYDA